MKKKQIIVIGIGLLSVIFVMISIPLFLFPNLYDVSESYYSGFFFDWNVFLLISGGLFVFSLAVFVMSAKKSGKPEELLPASHTFLLSAFAMMFFGLIIIITAIILGFSDMVRSTLILTSFTCFIMGFIFMTFHQDEPAFQHGILSSPVSEMMNECGILTKLCIDGNAHICEKKGGNGLYQYNPGIAGVSFQSIPQSPGTGAGSDGIALIPAGSLPLQRLESEYRMRIPDNGAVLADFIAELYTKHLELADSVDVQYDGDEIVLALNQYRHFQQCRDVEQQAPGCCARVPCPSCSLLACIFAKSMHAPVAFERLVLDHHSRTIRLYLKRYMPQK